MTDFSKKMSPSQILSHLLRGQGMSLDADAVREVINSLGEVGFSATKIAKIIKGDAAEIADFKKHLQELSKSNAELRKIAEIGTERINKSLKQPKSDAPVKEKPRKKVEGKAAKTPETPAEERSSSLFEMANDEHFDPMQAILRGPRPV